MAVDSKETNVTKPKTSKTNILRKFGNLECYEYHMIKLRYYSSPSITCRYTIPASLSSLESHELVSHFERAISCVVLEHPSLRSYITDTDSKRPSWCPIYQIDLPHVIEWQDITAEQDYDTLLSETIAKRLDSEFPNPNTTLWQCLLLMNRPQNYIDIIFDFSHSIADGMSGKLFHSTLLRVLNTPSSLTTPTITPSRVLQIPTTAPTLPLPLEKLVKFTYSPKWAISQGWQEMKPSLFSRKSSSNTKWCPIITSPYKSQIRTFGISAPILETLLSLCRKNKTTLTGLFQALILVSLSQHVKDPSASSFSGMTALDMRRHISKSLHDSDQMMGNIMSAMEHSFPPSLISSIRAASYPETETSTLDPALVKTIWQVASQVRAEIQKKLDLGVKNEIVGLMRFVPDWRAQFKESAKKPRPNAFAVTNCGAFDGDGRSHGKAEEDGKWNVTRALFCDSSEVCGALLCLSALSVKGGDLSVCVNWQDAALNRQIGDNVVKGVEMWLKLLGRTTAEGNGDGA
ncbi:alcohol acetyltransferase [Xylariaceae sp. FL1272]|nr:alcohol acetyltransferase [Xylariaceae sp. FL1272]